ncbi:MBL fold metallo-hydrolase [Psychrosphaera haliotis]|uniref:MBL fold metallo-hydrolase n=1 Tax=Psychrosphaera haliotis TaxID=555083 RepID=A0A6N8F518_9GAMM|nr:MBL fold metallo-hydrolase [Psychrosphaera haliotis]MUH71254.1 MBL fold metallo-hydrolase [Psychrosphaera haliotis]
MSNNKYTIQEFLDHDSETFSYVVFDRVSKQAVVIDPVLDFDYQSGRTSEVGVNKIAEYIDSNSLSLEWALETHAHADHISGAPYFKRKYGAKIGIGRHITKVQDTFKSLFNLEKEFLPNGCQFDQLFDYGDVIKLGQLQFTVMHTPGHTPADLVYFLENEVMFVGDTIFMPDVGTARCDFPGGSASQLFESIQLLLSKPEDTFIYVCHDYPTEGRSHRSHVSVKEQKESNKHVHDGISKAEFIEMRVTRDKGLAMPRLILPAIQLNIRAGEEPPKEENGTRYLKIPLNQL